jgi:hypothetical protein
VLVISVDFFYVTNKCSSYRRNGACLQSTGASHKCGNVRRTVETGPAARALIPCSFSENDTVLHSNCGRIHNWLKLCKALRVYFTPVCSGYHILRGNIYSEYHILYSEFRSTPYSVLGVHTVALQSRILCTPHGTEPEF